MPLQRLLLPVLPFVVLPVLMLAACDKPMSSAQQKVADDRAVAQVEATVRRAPFDEARLA